MDPADRYQRSLDLAQRLAWEQRSLLLPSADGLYRTACFGPFLVGVDADHDLLVERHAGCQRRIRTRQAPTCRNQCRNHPKY
jgi:hypothetical protein